MGCPYGFSGLLAVGGVRGSLATIKPAPVGGLTLGLRVPSVNLSSASLYDKKSLPLGPRPVLLWDCGEQAAPGNARGRSSSFVSGPQVYTPAFPDPALLPYRLSDIWSAWARPGISMAFRHPQASRARDAAPRAGLPPRVLPLSMMGGEAAEGPAVPGTHGVPDKPLPGRSSWGALSLEGRAQSRDLHVTLCSIGRRGRTVRAQVQVLPCCFPAGDLGPRETSKPQFPQM